MRGSSYQGDRCSGRRRTGAVSSCEGPRGRGARRSGISGSGTIRRKWGELVTKSVSASRRSSCCGVPHPGPPPRCCSSSLLLPNQHEAARCDRWRRRLATCCDHRGGRRNARVLPRPHDPLPRRDLRAESRGCLHPGSRIGLLEMWAMGRIERGESPRFGSIDSRTRVSVDGRSAYADALVLRPGETALDGFGLLEGNQYTVAGFWHWGDDRPLVEPTGVPGLTLVTGRPSTGTAYVRGMGSDGVSLHTAVRNVLSAQRAAWGLTPIDFRRLTSAFG